MGCCISDWKKRMVHAPATSYFCQVLFRCRDMVINLLTCVAESLEEVCEGNDGAFRPVNWQDKTAKPCNTVFSRSYDLTRHEDTIHSNRKQKVRCHLSTEEKTFSRNDALTRHMRVVHPDVDFPGKTRLLPRIISVFFEFPIADDCISNIFLKFIELCLRVS